MKLTTFFITKTKHIYVKTSTVLKSQFEIKAMLLWILFKIFLTSAVICKQIFLHENEIVKYLQDLKKLRRLSRSFYKAPTCFYKIHEKRLP